MPPDRASRPRIAILASHFAEYSRRLAAALSRHTDVLLITERRNDEAECEGLTLDAGVETLEWLGFRADQVLNPLSLRGYLQRRQIAQAISRFRPDILHVQEQGDAFTASVARRFAQDAHVILTVHDPAPHSGNDSVVACQFAKGIRVLRASARGFHVHGAWCAEELRKRIGPSRPILSTQHGIILKPEHARPPAPDAPFLFFGRMEAYKGVETLLAAIEQGAGGSPCRFIFAGRGPELERNAARIAGLTNVEVIARRISPREAVELFQRAGAVIVPYNDATQSGVISAAYANGRPVIATRVGGLPDAVIPGVSGLLVPPRDATALAAAIAALRDPRTRADLAAGARAEAEGRFAWDRIVADLFALYDGVRAL